MTSKPTKAFTKPIETTLHTLFLVMYRVDVLFKVNGRFVLKNREVEGITLDPMANTEDPPIYYIVTIV